MHPRDHGREGKACSGGESRHAEIDLNADAVVEVDAFLLVYSCEEAGDGSARPLVLYVVSVYIAHALLCDGLLQQSS